MRDLDNAPVQDRRLPEFLSGAALGRVKTDYEVLQLMRRCASHFGFSHFLVTRFPDGERQRLSERLLLSNWPPELMRTYDDRGVFHDSRLVSAVAVTKRPVHGDASLFAAKGAVQDEGTAKLLARHGLATSVAFLLHATAGEPFIAVFSGAGPSSDPEAVAGLYFGAVQLFECLEQTFSPGPSAREKLSSREIECLRWAAAGKSSDEIAIILGISTYTVSSYFKTATRKLGAVNRMQAIASAMRLKLI